MGILNCLRSWLIGPSLLVDPQPVTIASTPVKLILLTVLLAKQIGEIVLLKSTRFSNFINDMSFWAVISLNCGWIISLLTLCTSLGLTLLRLYTPRTIVTSLASWPLTQWAADRIHLSLMSDPPQKTDKFDPGIRALYAACHGQAWGGATSPLTIRLTLLWPQTAIDEHSLHLNWFV